ncbi:hemolysin family protein [Pleomorphomonas sp. PLEO]|uniref:hemolysin family protein n=1 Tax=Pleomorphomonas sp. PLEO TaxID=3239306 RepID=UPI00351F33CC
MGYLFEIGVIFILLILNGLFAMSELAVVSSRRPRLEAMAARGSKGAATVLKLAANPGRFMSSVQIGITLVGILAGAYSGATLSEPLASLLLAEGVPASIASGLAIALVVGLITYFSLVIGELVPKQIALANPEAVASLMARPMLGVAFIAAPVALILERSSRLIISALGLKSTGQSAVTEEEIKAVIAEGTSSGILEPEEKELMAGVMRFGDRSIRAVMIPRPDITGIDLEWDNQRIIEAIANSSHSRYPVFTGSIDMVQGVIQAKDLLDQHLKDEPLDIKSRIRQVDMVPDTASALDVLDTLRRSPLQMVMVIDEYGSVEGMVTAADILTAIVGNLGGETNEELSEIVMRADGSWLIDADLGVDLVAEKINCQGLDDPDRDYETLAGFVLSVTKAIPSTGDIVDWRGWTFEIVDMDSRRIDKVLVTAPRSSQA